MGFAGMQYICRRFPGRKEALNIYGFVREGGWLTGDFSGKICIQKAHAGDARIQTQIPRISGGSARMHSAADCRNLIEAKPGTKYSPAFG